MGRLQCADVQVMGKSVRLAMAEIRKWAKAFDSSSLVVGPDAPAAYKVLIKRLLYGVPHEVPRCESHDVWHVFTDGTSESDSNTVGGVLHRKGEAKVRYFSCKVPCELVDVWAGDMKRINGPVEAYGSFLLANMLCSMLIIMVPWMHTLRVPTQMHRFAASLLPSRRLNVCIARGRGSAGPHPKTIALMILPAVS